MHAPGPEDVHQALARLETSITPTSEQKTLTTLLTYPSYRIVLIRFGGEEHLGLAPDAQQRQLAAVFTTPEAATAYLDWLATYTAHKEPPRALVSPGQVLFPELNTLPLEGILFDPLGPSTPRAFQPALINLLASMPAAGPQG